MTKVLVIEDNANLAYLIKKYLERNNKNIYLCYTGDKGYSQALTNQYDIILLDIGLPQRCGLEIIKDLRDKSINIPCIIITNHRSLKNEINCFKLGANLYHKKPLNMELLNIQIDNLIKKYPKNNILNIGNLEIDFNKCTVRKNGNRISLTNTEYKLLTLLIQANGQTLSREYIISNISNINKDANLTSVDTMISRIRKKIHSEGLDAIIETVVKSGYRINLKYAQDINHQKV